MIKNKKENEENDMTLRERKMRKEGTGLACPLVAGPGIRFEYRVLLGF